MIKIVKVYCEGKKGSHDYDILEKVIDGLPQIQLEPIGSIRGAGAIIQYKENEVSKSSYYLLFRDRDFDKEIPAISQLEQDPEKKYCYFSYRNTIENYLFNTSHFLAFLKKENLCEKYALTNEVEVKSKFIQAAEKIKFYQAVRHTMGKMRTGETNFGTKLTDNSGTLPISLDENYCKTDAIKRISYAKSFTDTWDEKTFNEIYDTFVKKFDSNFMNNLDFLIYFQGKDFATSLKSILPEDFPLKKYYKFAKDIFDYTQYPDLIELRKKIESNI